MHRWLENVSVTEQVVNILPNLKQCVTCVDAKKVKHMGRKLFEMVQSA